MNQRTLHYAAGVFDVRGSILMSRAYANSCPYRYPRVRLNLINKKAGVLDYLKQNFGGCITNADGIGYVKQWTTSNKKAIEFISAILPYMQNKKRIKQINFILNNWEIYETNKLTKKQIKKRERFYINWTKLLHA